MRWAHGSRAIVQVSAQRRLTPLVRACHYLRGGRRNVAGELEEDPGSHRAPGCGGGGRARRPATAAVRPSSLPGSNEGACADDLHLEAHLNPFDPVNLMINYLRAYSTRTWTAGWDAAAGPTRVCRTPAHARAVLLAPRRCARAWPDTVRRVAREDTPRGACSGARGGDWGKGTWRLRVGFR